MATEARYERQIGTRAAQPRPFASAETFGAGVAQGLGQMGDALHRAQLTDYAIERRATADAETTRFMHDFAKYREVMDGVSREGRLNARPGGELHGQNMADAVEAGRSALLDGITEDNVRRMADQQFTDYAARFKQNEANWAEVQRAEKTVTDFSDGSDIASNRIRRLEDPRDYVAEVDLAYAQLAELRVDEGVKAKLKEEIDQKYAIAFVQGRIDADPELAKAMIEKGVFDAALQPNQVEALLKGADVEIRSREVAARAAQAQQASEFNQTMSEVRKRIGLGEDLSDQFPALLEQARALGRNDIVVEIEGFAGEAQFAKIYAGATPAQMQNRLAEIGAKPKPTVMEQREAKWISQVLPGKTQSYTADPVGWAVANAPAAAKPPPLDMADPASIAARDKWARARDARNPVPLSQAEVAPLRERYATGRAGAVEVMDMLTQFSPQVRAAAARQIDPNDAQLRVMLEMDRGGRNLALDGRDALKANPKLIAAEKDSDTERLIQTYRAGLDEALRGWSPADRAAVLKTADQIGAGWLARNGGEISGPLMATAINTALGARGTGRDRKGGIELYNGHWFLLPDNVGRETFARAVVKAATAKDGPVEPDGKTPAAIGRAWPVWIGPNLYEFHGPGGVLKRKNGEPWRVRIGGQP